MLITLWTLCLFLSLSLFLPVSLSLSLFQSASKSIKLFVIAVIGPLYWNRQFNLFGWVCCCIVELKGVLTISLCSYRSPLQVGVFPFTCFPIAPLKGIFVQKKPSCKKSGQNDQFAKLSWSLCILLWLPFCELGTE